MIVLDGIALLHQDVLTARRSNVRLCGGCDRARAAWAFKSLVRGSGDKTAGRLLLPHGRRGCCAVRLRRARALRAPLKKKKKENTTRIPIRICIYMRVCAVYVYNNIVITIIIYARAAPATPRKKNRTHYLCFLFLVSRLFLYNTLYDSTSLFFVHIYTTYMYLYFKTTDGFCSVDKIIQYRSIKLSYRTTDDNNCHFINCINYWSYNITGTQFHIKYHNVCRLIIRIHQLVWVSKNSIQFNSLRYDWL